MSISRPFILRPIATSLLMAALLLVGLVAYRQLPISALPQVDYPTIQVVTFYPGASPDVTASSITSPLERQFGQLPGLNQMTSSSSFGASVITLQFELEENIDVAEQEVQAAINSAQTFLPADLPTPPIYIPVLPPDLGIWGGANEPFPTPPIYLPIKPPDGAHVENPIYYPLVPSHPIVLPPETPPEPPDLVWPPDVPVDHPVLVKLVAFLFGNLPPYEGPPVAQPV